MRFKVQIISALLLAAAPALAENLTTVSFEGAVDVSNLFYSHEKVNYRDYGVPDEVAHRYTFTTTYVFPKNLKATAENEIFPPGQTCNSDWEPCEDYPSFKRTTLQFKNQEMKIYWEFFDAKTGKLLGTQSNVLVVTFTKDGTPSEEIQFNENTARGRLALAPGQDQNGLTDQVQFMIPVPKTLNGYSLTFGKNDNAVHFEDTVFRVKKSGNEYTLKIDFDHKKLAKPWRVLQGASIDIDRKKYGFYFGVAETGEDYPGYTTILRSFAE